MKTRTAIKKAGGATALAELFSAHLKAWHCRRQAVHQWGENLPQLREFQLREIKPEWFKKPAR